MGISNEYIKNICYTTSCSLVLNIINICAIYVRLNSPPMKIVFLLPDICTPKENNFEIFWTKISFRGSKGRMEILHVKNRWFQTYSFWVVDSQETNTCITRWGYNYNMNNTGFPLVSCVQHPPREALTYCLWWQSILTLSSKLSLATLVLGEVSTREIKEVNGNKWELEV